MTEINETSSTIQHGRRYVIDEQAIVVDVHQNNNLPSQ
jgi:hypothetical protein